MVKGGSHVQELHSYKDDKTDLNLDQINARLDKLQWRQASYKVPLTPELNNLLLWKLPTVNHKLIMLVDNEGASGQDVK